VSLVNEFSVLLYSDVSTASLDQLVTRWGLWLRNTLVHLESGFILYFVLLHRPQWRDCLIVAVWIYLGLQIVQLWSPGNLRLLVLDGVFDIVIAFSGYALGALVALRGVRR
jgi:hypothetical protein